MLNELYEKGLTIIPWIGNASDAELINDLANDAFARGYQEYIKAVDRAGKSIQKLDQRKVEIIRGEMVKFLNAMEVIKNIDYQDNYVPTEYKPYFNEESLMVVRKKVMGYYEIFKTQPLFLNTLYLHNKSKEVLNNAKINRANIEIKLAQLETEMEKAEIVVSHTKQLDRILRNLLRQVKVPLMKMTEIVENNSNWKQMSQAEKQTIMVVVKYMQLIKTVIDMPIIKEDGGLNKEIETITKNKEILQMIEAKN